MDVLNIFAVIVIVCSVVMIVLHSAVVFVLKKRGMIASERTYRSERTIGTICWLMLIIAMAWVLLDTGMNGSLRLSIVIIAAALFGGLGGIMFADDLAFYRRNERRRIESLARC